MTAEVAQLWRHPIKGHGREAVDRVVIPGQTMPGDRVWAVAHEASKADGSEWVPLRQFQRGAKAPQLMAVSAQPPESPDIAPTRTVRI